MTMTTDAQHHPTDETSDRGPRVRCTATGCIRSFPLRDGVGPVGSKTWTCPTHGEFGPGLTERRWSGRLRS